MSIYGVGNSNFPRTPAQLPVRDNTRPAGQPAVPATPTPAQLIQQSPAIAKPAQAVPAEAPAGTDPALWSVLSGEERAFFAKAGAMGPLTYGRAFQDMKSTQLPASRGGRLDIKV
ncbi:MAG TPA: hypothetical protein VK636_11290 [Gemmatimonadaceae bacterium]|nr:hypothetical protein [Gemmatimonadaceae bacterium]